MAGIAILIAALLDPIKIFLCWLGVWLVLKTARKVSNRIMGLLTVLAGVVLISAAISTALRMEPAPQIIATLVWFAVFAALLFRRQLRLDRDAAKLPQFTEAEMQKINRRGRPWLSQ